MKQVFTAKPLSNPKNRADPPTRMDEFKIAHGPDFLHDLYFRNVASVLERHDFAMPSIVWPVIDSLAGLNNAITHTIHFTLRTDPSEPR